MFCSMTGYGEAVRQTAAMRVGFRIRGVNHKGLDVQFRLPLDLSYLETELRTRIKGKCFRGRLDITSEIEIFDPQISPPLQLDQTKLNQILQAFDLLTRDERIAGPLDVNTLIRINELFLTRRVGFQLPLAETEFLYQVFDEALVAFIAARAKEGDVLAEDLANRLSNVEAALDQVASAAEGRESVLREQMMERLRQVAADVEVDESRLCQEVVFQVDRLDITEEITRLRMHIEKGQDMLANPFQPSGKALEFLLQEMFREVTTIGNKAKHIGIAQSVVFLKTELEKIKEQILNIE